MGKTEEEAEETADGGEKAEGGERRLKEGEGGDGAEWSGVLDPDSMGTLDPDPDLEGQKMTHKNTKKLINLNVLFSGLKASPVH